MMSFALMTSFVIFLNWLIFWSSSNFFNAWSSCCYSYYPAKTISLFCHQMSSPHRHWILVLAVATKNMTLHMNFWFTNLVWWWSFCKGEIIFDLKNHFSLRCTRFYMSSYFLFPFKSIDPLHMCEKYYFNLLY